MFRLRAILLPLRVGNVATRSYATASGWFPPEGGNESLPFHLERSRTGNLPFYTDVKDKGARVSTVVRNIRGDMKAAVAEFIRVCETKDVELKVAQIRIKGNHMRRLREWAKANKI